jgi:8-amino-7-oxononanoate synthase
MMSEFDEELATRLDAIREQGLYRELRRINSPQLPHTQVDSKTLLNFSSNDYLGLANDPLLKEAATRGIERYGAGSGASRLICGSLAPHHELEQAIAAFKGTEAAIAFSSGYAAALGMICALIDAHDVIAIDKLVHACIVDAGRLSGAKLRVFTHNDLNGLAKILRWADRRHAGLSGKRRPRTLIVTESVFSMDGDFALLRELLELKEQHGAWLMLDEAHATGLYGEKRRGLAEEFGVAERIEVQMGTLGKALGAAGGYICGSRVLIDYLVNRSRTFIFSTAPVPAAAAAAAAAIHFVQSDEGQIRRNQLWARVDQVKNGLIAAGFVLPPVRSAIIPLVIGDETRAVEVAAAMREQGVFVPAIRHPTVARGQARLRLTVSAAHAAADVSQLVTAVSNLKSEICR